MVRVVTMLVGSLLVGGAMWLIFRWFLKRLSRIEEDYWGKKK